MQGRALTRRRKPDQPRWRRRLPKTTANLPSSPVTGICRYGSLGTVLGGQGRSSRGEPWPPRQELVDAVVAVAALVPLRTEATKEEKMALLAGEGET